MCKMWKKHGLLFWMLGFTAMAAANAKLSRISVDPETGYFLDSSGRVRMFHGINSVVKGFPYYDDKLVISTERYTQLEQLGINMIRLGAMWTGLEPVRDELNTTYLSILQSMVSTMADHGIYALLDMHQDVLWMHESGGSDDQGYWGVPPWIKDLLSSSFSNPYPYPFDSIKQWECGYFTEEISKGFGAFYGNANSTATRFIHFWKVLVKTFRSQSSVLGYEIINEPWTGDIFTDLSLLLPGVAGHRFLQPLHDQVSDAIRKLDTDTIIFWEPTTWAYLVPFDLPAWLQDYIQTIMSKLTFNASLVKLLQSFCSGSGLRDVKPELMNLVADVMLMWSELENTVMAPQPLPQPSITGPGFSQVPGGDAYRNRTVMSWHYYCWLLPNDQANDRPYDWMIRLFCDSFMGPMAFRSADLRARHLGGGHMLTEFGLCSPNISNPESQGSIECNFVLEQAEAHMQSWCFWDTASGFSFWDDAGHLIRERVMYFARPYPTATSGRPHKLSFDMKTRIFTYYFYPDVSRPRLATEIFLPTIQYPEEEGGFQVTTSPNLNWFRSAKKTNRLLIYPKPSTPSGSLAFVTISPPPPE